MNKKTFASIIAVLSIIGYGAFVFAQPFTPGETIDPGCGPLDLTCTIIQAWEQDLANNLVFNNTTNIGIGVDDSNFGLGFLTPDVHIHGNSQFCY